MKKWSCLILVALLGCGASNNEPANNTTSNNTTTPNNASTNTSTSNTSSTNTSPNNTSNGGSNNTSAPTNGSGDLILPCEDLTFNDSCANPMAASGYPACSDYFGNSESEVTCGANPTNVYSTSPCPAYEFYVGSCVYYTDALPDNCYITHVGAESADQVQAGRDFWSNPAVCANWVEGP